ncbi:hypothetical protein [Streptomyces sp.]|uniref:hypothetical protein n=1 Tax=Streptomyces sp. TaxID=1931 RepID=UPI002F40F956
MSEASERGTAGPGPEEPAGVVPPGPLRDPADPFRDTAAAAPEPAVAEGQVPEAAVPEAAVAGPALAPRERIGRLRAFRHRERRSAALGATRAESRRRALSRERERDRSRPHPPEGLAASLVTSGGLLLAMVEDVRMRGSTEPADLRLLADTFARHNAAKEATVRKVLDRHGVAREVVERDRQEGTLLQGILDRALMGRHPVDTHTLTVDGALAQMYQYLFHERRDLVPALERAVPREESETLAAAFEAIDRV